MEETKTNFNWKRLLITLTLVLLTAGAVGGGVYYVQDQNFKKERGESDKVLQELQSKVKEEKKTTTASTTTEKSYTDSISGISFTFPSNWNLIEMIGIPEGSGIPFKTLSFSESKGTNVSIKNGLDIEIRKAAKAQVRDEIEKSYLQGVQVAPVNITLAGKNWKKYPNEGGFASTVTRYVLSDDNYLLYAKVDNYDSAWDGKVSKNVVVAEAEKILNSIKFN